MLALNQVPHIPVSPDRTSLLMVFRGGAVEQDVERYEVNAHLSITSSDVNLAHPSQRSIAEDQTTVHHEI